MVMSFAVGESLLLVVSSAEKGFFALGADKVLHMPLFAERVDHAIFNRSPASTANRNAHLVVTTKTEQVAVFLPRFRV